MWIYILQGVGYGFAAASQPGPFQTYLIQQSLTRGWRHTLPAALAPLISDGPIILLCVLVLSQVPPWMARALYLVGGVFVLYLAWGAMRAWQRFQASVSADSAGPQSILKAAMMNALSPGPYIFWTLVSGPVLIAGWHESVGTGAVFLAGFYGTLIGMLAAIILVFGLAARIGPRMNRAMIGLSAIALTGFGIYQLVRGLQ